MGVKEAGVTGRGLLAGLMTVGFVAAFAGVRVVDGTVWLAVPVTLLGVVAVGVATGWQLFRRRGAEGDRRKVESVFAWSYLGCGLALVGLLLGTEAVVDWLGIEFSSPRTRVRYDQGVLTVSSALLAVSAVTVVAAEWAARRSGGRAVSSVDVLRVRETASNASSVAVAGIALMLLGYVASARNRTIDASYFKTSEPGEAVQAIARNLGSPLRVALFFPPVNAVKDEVHTYFRGAAGLRGRRFHRGVRPVRRPRCGHRLRREGGWDGGPAAGRPVRAHRLADRPERRPRSATGSGQPRAAGPPEALPRAALCLHDHGAR